MALEVKIDKFEGPLDLLLHLIKKNEMDIYDIHVAQITEQYLAIIDAMRELNFDVAGEFLVMASTLIHIKSRLLLPARDEEDDPEGEEEDPRAELVRRLLEYKKYKEAAGVLEELPRLGRDVHARKFPSPEIEPAAETEFEEVGLFELVDVLQDLLRESPPEAFHEVDIERLSVTERLNGILASLEGRQSLAFQEVFSEAPNRHEVAVTFLAMLELVKLRMVKLMQNSRHGTIWIFPTVDDAAVDTEISEDALGYN
ncbi:MAG: segregation/condensation protein A [Desulfuromonadales bacterium]|nr:segregation/condensation protein A [Desulfuromonadales bacterium]NIR34182.1 segregation/condensation protein A [Desulfuromonadales bacterium]NIS41629.1 segregation/condensation protein A [Desulfuromonadales bacterium]